MTAGKAKDGMVDMTGGVGESLEVEDFRSEEQKKRLFKILRSSYEDKSLMSASIRVSLSLVYIVVLLLRLTYKVSVVT